MRPVTRGAIPNNATGHPKEYHDYRDVGNDLQVRLGDYCSYCERQIETHLAVEHIRPKKPGGVAHSDRVVDWTNFLLGCVHCNSCKGDKDVDLADYVWPDVDNTFRAIVYSTAGVVNAAELDPMVTAKAEAIIRLVGLDIVPGNADRNRCPSESDKRWIKRREVWKLAERARERLANDNTTGMREQIVETATGRGLFSIWMTVFAHDSDMRLRFIRAFTGTAADCFDADGHPQPRPGGKC